MENIKINNDYIGSYCYTATMESRGVKLLRKAFKKHKVFTGDVEVSIGYNGETLAFLFGFGDFFCEESLLIIPGQSVNLPENCSDEDKIKKAIRGLLYDINSYESIPWDNMVKRLKKSTSRNDRKEEREEKVISFYEDAALVYELGCLYRELINLVNNTDDNPVFCSDIYPVLPFDRLAVLATEQGMFTELNDRICAFRNQLGVDEWGKAADERLPSDKKAVFLCGMHGFRLKKLEEEIQQRYNKDNAGL